MYLASGRRRRIDVTVDDARSAAGADESQESGKRIGRNRRLGGDDGYSSRV